MADDWTVGLVMELIEMSAYSRSLAGTMTSEPDQGQFLHYDQVSFDWELPSGVLDVRDGASGTDRDREDMREVPAADGDRTQEAK